MQLFTCIRDIYIYIHMRQDQATYVILILNIFYTLNKSSLTVVTSD